MTTAAPDVHRVRVRDAARPGGLDGTWALLRLAARRDRVRLLVWTASILVMWGYAAVALDSLFPTAVDRQLRGQLMSSPAAVILTGSGFGLDDYTLGAMVANEMGFMVLLALALLAIQTAVRSTRAEEETGATEILRASTVGRHAPAVAAYLLVVAVNVVIGVGTWGVLVAVGLAPGGAAALGAAGAATGLFFGAVGIVTAQLTTHARSASGLALAVLGLAWVVRAAGDLRAQGGSPLSWASPLAWALQTRAFVDTRWWTLGLLVVGAVVLHVLGARLGGRRDLGAGLVTTRPGRAYARASLVGSVALAVRLQRGSILAWAAGVGLGAVATGTFTDSVAGMVSKLPQLGDLLGDAGALVDAFAALMVMFFVVLVAGFALSSFHRVRTEEQRGRLETVLSAPVARTRWLGAQLAVTLGASVVLLVLAGLGLWAGAVSVGDGSVSAGAYVVAALGHVPAVALLVAVAVVVHGWWPHGSGLVWGWYGFSAVAAVYGGLLRLPGWLLDVVPFTHSPVLPGPEASWTGALVMAALAVGLGALGIVGFRRRDVPAL